LIKKIIIYKKPSAIIEEGFSFTSMDTIQILSNPLILMP